MDLRYKEIEYCLLSIEYDLFSIFSSELRLTKYS